MLKSISMLLVTTVVTSIAFQQEATQTLTPVQQQIEKPKEEEKEKEKEDEGGIKWSTIEQCFKEIPIHGGGTAKYPQIWCPYPERPTYCYFGFSVCLTNGKTIKVWAAPEDARSRPEEDCDSWCHGVPFGCGGIYSPGGNEVPKILDNCYEKCGRDSKKGDVVVFCNKRTGTVAHTATANGDGTFCSKNRYEKKGGHGNKSGNAKGVPSNTI